MKTLDEDTALAIIFANIRRKKRTEDLITIAKAFEYLEGLYGSRNAVAKTVGLSVEMVRQFLTLLKLPKQVRDLFESRKIDSVDIGRELAALNNRENQIISSKMIADLPTKDVRDIKKLIKRDLLPLKESMEIVLEAKPKGLHIFMIDFDEETHKSLMKQAKNARVQPAQLVKEIISNWLAQKTNS